MTNREALEELKRRLEKRGVIDFDIMILEWLEVLEDMGVKVHKNIVPWIERKRLYWYCLQCGTRRPAESEQLLGDHEPCIDSCIDCGGIAYVMTASLAGAYERIRDIFGEFKRREKEHET